MDRQAGAAAVEYAILVGLIAVVILGVVGALGMAILPEERVDRIVDALDGDEGTPPVPEPVDEPEPVTPAEPIIPPDEDEPPHTPGSPSDGENPACQVTQGKPPHCP
jgi:Flp pilus assembly pilin Flp